MDPNLVPNQMDSGIPYSWQLSACGPAAAVAMGRTVGRDDNFVTVVNLAKANYGWTPELGMGGTANFIRLLKGLNISPASENTGNHARIMELVKAGHVVTISMPKHYAVIDAVDSSSRFHFGRSGSPALTKGSVWMTIDAMEALEGLTTDIIYLGAVVGTSQAQGWEKLAIQECNRQNAYIPVVLAIVYAESTGHNITGDRDSLGYGQVRPSQRMIDFIEAAKILNMAPPPEDLSSLAILVLNNDTYSMAVAVHSISRDWEANKPSFQKTYENYNGGHAGANIALSVRQRYEAAWAKYSNMAFDGPTSLFSPYNDFKVDATYDEVVPESAIFGDNIYGRRYRILVTNQISQPGPPTFYTDVGLGDAIPVPEVEEVSLDVSQLRCVFTCVRSAMIQPNYSTVTIYNLSPKHENTIIQEGFRIIIEAGYSGSRYGVIFDGNVIQPIRTKEGGTTYLLTLVSMDSDQFLNYGLVNLTLLRGQNSRSMLGHIINGSSVPTSEGQISPTLSSKLLPRGKVLFGKSADILSQVAKSENATYYMEDGRVNIVRANDPPPGEVIELSPSTGLIGVPSQVEYGASIRMLLDPRVRIGSRIHIDNSLIRNQQFMIGQAEYVLDTDGLYNVIKVTHRGDTRGNDWYTEVETVSQVGILPTMISGPSQASH